MGGCMWINQGTAKGCISNVCGFRNSASDCVLQNTEGRCVWFSKSKKGKNAQESSRGLDGGGQWTPNPIWSQQFNGPRQGCYNSPCSTPLPNKPWKCEANGN